MQEPFILLVAPSPPFKFPDATAKQVPKLTADPAAVAPPPPENPIVDPPCGPIGPGKSKGPPGFP